MKKHMPVYDMLRGYKSKMRFHMPGHKGKLSKFDVTELSFSDNLLSPSGVIQELNETLANFYNARFANVLTCGGTSGIFSMLSQFEGKTLVVDRYSHVSIYHALRLYQITPIFINNQVHLGGRVVDIKEAETAAERADGVLLTYPNYYGEVFDVQTLYQNLKQKNKVLLLDACHASHFAYSPLLPKNPAPYCDMCVFSLHKTTLALTQAALICSNLESPIKSVAKIHSTSPSYLICCSIDISHQNMLKYYSKFLKKLETVLQKREDGGDLTRLVVETRDGYAAGERLERKKIYPEFCDYKNAVFILSLADSLAKIKKLLRALKEVSGECKVLDKEFTAEQGDFLRQGQTEIVPISQAENRVCAQSVGFYPPGVPFLTYGEKITRPILDLIQNNHKHLFGVTNGIEVFQ